MPVTTRLGLLLGAICVLLSPQNSCQPAPPTGPAAEKRFPPLKLPEGFKATLFACDPFIEYPSAIAMGPRKGSIFVAVDYMTGLGTEIVRKDEIRLLEDTDGDGYADRSTVFAKDFNSIMGLAYHDGTLYVMHAPFLTALRDTDGDGKADQRRDLLSGVGLTPEKNPVRLHCANGVIMGHDGWLYLALGDNGCAIPRQGAKDLVLEGGGILRCRPDGSHVHVFATGLRNIYDVALDEDLNVFVRDNENDGGDYKIRVCHSFFGADHGYPYLYYEHRDEAMPPLADLGLGSSAGGLCYLETMFPAEYRGNLFFCEWGKSVVRYPLEKSGSGFAQVKEIEFASGAAKDPYPFKPTDLSVDHDGALFVADWADGQRPLRGRGRIYRITSNEKARQVAGPNPEKVQPSLAQLDSESYYQRIDAQAAFEKRGQEGAKVLREALEAKKLGVRGRMHAVWALAKVNRSIRDLVNIAKADPGPRVQVQAVRAVADLADPSLGGPRSDAQALAALLADFAKGKDPRAVREVVVALGRLEWAEAPARLGALLNGTDPALEHAVQQTLRRSGNWPAVLKLLDLPDEDRMRSVALRAIADRAEPVIVDGLIERLSKEKEPSRRLAYADALTRIYKKPGPWVYWGYRPAPRPAHPTAWERTAAIEETLNLVLADPDPRTRLAIQRRMQREKIPLRPETLAMLLGKERGPENVAALLEAMRQQPAAAMRQPLRGAVEDKTHTTANRLQALALLADNLDKKSAALLVDLAQKLEEGPVLAALLKRLGPLSLASARELLVEKLASKAPEVRASAMETLADFGIAEAGKSVPAFLEDPDPQVRRAAALAAGKLQVRSATDLLLKKVRDSDALTRRACLEALFRLEETRVVPLAVTALSDSETDLAALQCVTRLGTPDQAKPVRDLAKRHPSAEILDTAVRGLMAWSGRQGLSASARAELHGAVADLHGASGTLLHWRFAGPLAEKELARALAHLTSGKDEPLVNMKDLFASGLEARWNLGKTGELQGPATGVWLASTEVQLVEGAAVQFLASSTAPYRVWLGGKLLFQRDKAGAFVPDSDRFNAKLEKGTSRVVVQLSASKKNPDFHLRFRRVSSRAEHEKLIDAALNRPGNPERGRKVFLAAEKSACIKCHRLGELGEKIGPDLSGVGSRFSRIYLVESILEPSRTIAPSFDSLLVELKDGRILTGLPIAETDDVLTLADNQGQKHALVKSAIAERRRIPQSTMPEGLEQRLSAEEFVDLIAFLASQKAGR